MTDTSPGKEEIKERYFQKSTLPNPLAVVKIIGGKAKLAIYGDNGNYPGGVEVYYKLSKPRLNRLERLEFYLSNLSPRR